MAFGSGELKSYFGQNITNIYELKLKLSMLCPDVYSDCELLFIKSLALNLVSMDLY